MLLGIDISSHDVAAVLADADGAAVLALRAARPVEGGTPAVWLAAVEVARECLQRVRVEAAQVRCVALAMDAPVDAAGIVGRDARSEGWQGFDVPRALREHLGIGEARAESRVVCEALGEARFGALRPVPPVTPSASSSAGNAQNTSSTHDAQNTHGTQNAHSDLGASDDWLFVHIGATLGAAAQVNGRLLRGASGAALDIGAICIERDGALGANGRRGCLEAYCGGDSFAARAAGYGLTLKTAREVWNLAASDFAARSVCDDYVRRLAQGLGIAVATLNPRRVALGGTLCDGLGETLLAPLRASIREFCAPAHMAALEIISAQLGHDAAALGAVALAMD